MYTKRHDVTRLFIHLSICSCFEVEFFFLLHHQIVRQSQAITYKLSATEVRDWQFAGILPQDLEISTTETDGPHSLSVSVSELLPGLREKGRTGYRKFLKFLHSNSSRYNGLLDSLGKKREQTQASVETTDPGEREDAEANSHLAFSTVLLSSLSSKQEML